ncbi:hypothetical protein RSAG8_10061, partial [Rhizoctonia solani AG-8 WAC10335]
MGFDPVDQTSLRHHSKYPTCSAVVRKLPPPLCPITVCVTIAELSPANYSLNFHALDTREVWDYVSAPLPAVVSGIT